MAFQDSYKPGDRVGVNIGRGFIAGTVKEYDEATGTVVIVSDGGTTVKRNKDKVFTAPAKKAA